MNISKKKIWLAILSLLMLIPCYFGVLGIYYFYTGPDRQYRIESLMVLGYMAVYSLVLVIPYLISLFVFRRKVTKQFKLLTAAPFALMLLLTIVGTCLGIPW
jgi:cytochrome c biogenesis protein CcdA